MTILNHSIPYVHSPNSSSRRGNKIAATVIHYTGGGSTSGTIAWLTMAIARVSCHFLIGRDGDRVQMVDLDRAAWHAGVSEIEIDGEKKTNANLYTIGIELANHGLLQKIDGSFYYRIGGTLKKYRSIQPEYGILSWSSGYKVEGFWEPYPDDQINSLQELLLQLKKIGYGNAVNNLIGHEEIALPIGRKSDPGPLFPWNRFLRKTDRLTNHKQEGVSNVVS